VCCGVWRFREIFRAPVCVAYQLQVCCRCVAGVLQVCASVSVPGVSCTVCCSVLLFAVLVAIRVAMCCYLRCAVCRVLVAMCVAVCCCLRTASDTLQLQQRVGCSPQIATHCNTHCN